MTKTSYEDLAGFEQVYLEDSYVLDIVEHPADVQFVLDLVLTEQHPLYRPPRPDEQYCYRPATLRFPNPSQVTWVERNMRQYADAAGEIDYGNLDTFYAEDGVYHLSGDWGAVEILSDAPRLDIRNGDRA